MTYRSRLLDATGFIALTLLGTNTAYAAGTAETAGTGTQASGTVSSTVASVAAGETETFLFRATIN